MLDRLRWWFLRRGKSLRTARTESGRTLFVTPDSASEDGRYATPEEAALSVPRQLDETPRLVAVRPRDDGETDVEVDLGRHPADRIVYHCAQEPDGRWWVHGSSAWFHRKPDIVAVAHASDGRALFINRHPHVDGYELMITEYDFESTHASHHATIDDAEAYAVEKTGETGLEWQSWTPLPEDS